MESHIQSTLKCNINNDYYIPFTYKGLHIMHLNIQHLLPKLDEIRVYLHENSSLDIVGFCETFLNDKTEINTISISGYSIVRRDRAISAGGGIIVYIKDSISFVRRHDLESDDIESIWLQINIVKYKPYLINFVYRPPNSPQSWIDSFELQINKADMEDCNMYSTGDFNFHCLSQNIFNNKKWEKLITDFNLKQHVSFPTRVTERSSSILDHLYSKYDNISEVIIPKIGISDHYPVVFTLSVKGKIVKTDDHKIIKYRCFNKFNEINFQNDLANANFDMVETIEDANEAFEVFYNILNSVLNKNAPIKYKKVKRLQQPGWYNENVKQARSLRDKYKRESNWPQYKLWRNKCNSAIKMAKKEYFSNAVQNKTSAKSLWKTIKLASNEHTESSILPNVIRKDDRIISGKTNVANALNDHFVDISKLIKKTKFAEHDFHSLKTYLDAKLESKHFSVQFITTSEVSTLINQLHSNKSAGADGIGPSIIKLCKEFIIQPITALINNCISHGTFPDMLKIANVIPLYKGGSVEDPNNYRPISLLPTISKIFEKHIAKQLHIYLESTGLLNKTQSGFRKYHSCQTALINIVDSWLKQIDNGNLVGTIFLDFKKAFDLVDHRVLLHKLKLYHFNDRSCDLFSSYLRNRFQFIKAENTTSTCKSIIAGVPQGSILGPLLFLIYVNDLSLDLTCDSAMYADDTTLHTVGTNIQTLQNKLQTNLSIVNDWCQTNNMIINPLKTTCMVLGSKRKAQNMTDLKLKISDTVIKTVNCQKLLGLYIDNTLSWKLHINSVCSKMSSRMFLLQKIKPYLTLEMRKLFYNGYISPISDYACVTWSSAAKTEINRIVKIQKRCGAHILNKKYNTNSKTLFKDLKWLTFEQRNHYFTSVIVFKAFHNQTPTYIRDLLTPSQNNHYNLRSCEKGDLKLVRIPKTNYFKQSFEFSSKTIWNSLPQSIRQTNNLITFKKKLKAYLSSTLYEIN